MKLTICGKGSVELNQADFLAQGGEGAVYVRGDTAYKVYADPAKMIPTAKIAELAVLTLPTIVRPQEVLLDGRKRPVGYTMRRVQNGTPLCRLFTRAFRERMGVTPETTAQLVQRLREGVQFVHERRMLIVDLNELNLLADLPARKVHFIDVDSYQTPSFPATAIMESVRDRHATRFSADTDWFAFGIVSFQLFIGIHPYKGKHPTLTDLDARMQHHVSVFNANVSLPGVCYPLTVIPQAYRDWFHAVFEEGKRCAPPEDLIATITLLPVPQPQAIRGTGVHLNELARFPAEIVFPVEELTIGWNGKAALTTDGFYTPVGKLDVPGDAEIVFTSSRHRPVAAWTEGGWLRLYDLATPSMLDCKLNAETVTRYEERLYVKNDDGLYQVEFVELPGRTLATLRRVGNALRHATKLYDGVAIQSLLGACYVGIFPERDHYRTIHVPELDGYTILNARYERGVLIVVGNRNGKYDQLILRFDESYGTYDLRMIADVSGTDINFVTLPSGVCARLTDAGDLELFFRQKGSSEIKLLTDPALPGIRLFTRGTQLLCARQGVLYHMQA
jgi:hypothetical protein